jgi:hypothetical protein
MNVRILALFRTIVIDESLGICPVNELLKDLRGADKGIFKTVSKSFETIDNYLKQIVSPASTGKRR